MCDKDKIFKKMSKVIENFNQKNLSETHENDIFDTIYFPIVKKVFSTTLANGGWYKSEKQQLKENRINKLRLLEGEKPNISLPDDMYINGLVSVKPLSTHLGSIFYMDYKYDTPIKTKRKKKLNNINKIIRKEKIKYIQEILSKNN